VDDFSGKSYNSEIEEAGNLASKKDYKLLIIQELDKGSADGYYAGLVDKIEQFEQTPAYNITTSSTKITNNINGNTVLFRGYKTPQQKKDVKNIDQVTKIVVEEGEWMSFDDFLSLIQQLRGKVEEDRRLDILLNPVDEDCFVNKDIIETTPDRVLEYFPGTKRPKVFEKIMKIDTVDENGEPKHLEIKILVVISVHYDNPYLSDIQRAAIEIYRTADKEKWLQLGEARFIRPGGAFFKEFDKDVHVIEPFGIPNHWDRYVSLDYGLDMFAVGFYAIDTYGKHYLYRVIDIPDLIISEAAATLKEARGNENIRYYYAPVDLWSRRQETGRSVSEIFEENGIRLEQASNDRIAGALAMKELLKVYDSVDVETGEVIKDTKLKIFNTCLPIIHSLNKVLTDEKSSDKYALTPHDITHTLDQLRYYATGRQKPTKVKKATRPNVNTHKRMRSWNGYN